ncbi:MAG: glycosyltransferase [Bdellovibrionales bacterium]|nr:glycosyltransferase [Bdellovibrionales bacterium]
MKNKKLVLSLLGFAGARLPYKELALSLAKESLVKNSFDIWAFETDRPYLKEMGLPIEEKILFFAGVPHLLTVLQKSQSDQPVILNPIGLAPVKTFALTTISFVLPLDKTKLWAPLQTFQTPQSWEEFSDLILSSHLVIHCSQEKSANYPFSFRGFREFVQQLDLAPVDSVIEATLPVRQTSPENFNLWLIRAKENAAPTMHWSQDTAPLVSVITPSFNHAHFIQRTINSILEQDYPNFEYIVVDGGSSDDTLTVLKPYEDRLTWISEKDRGYADAVRKGFDRAKGKYLCWIPSDDEFFDSSSLSNLVSAAERTSSDVVFGNCIYINEYSDWLDQYKTSSFNVLRLKNWCLIPQPSTLIRASMYRKTEGISPELASVADYDLWLRIAEAGGKFLRLGAPISKYRLHSRSITTCRTASTYSEVIRLQIHRYGAAFPGWVRGGIGEIIHHLKGRPPVSGNPLVAGPPRGKFRVMLKSGLVEPIVIQIPFLQRLLALILHRIDG